MDDELGSQSGFTGLNSDPPYAIENIHAEVRWLATTPFRVSNPRAPGKIGNVLAVESFFDELAAAAGVDPLEYRLLLLPDPRGLKVLEQVGAMMDWAPRISAPDRSGELFEGPRHCVCPLKASRELRGMGVDAMVERSFSAWRAPTTAA